MIRFKQFLGVCLLLLALYLPADFVSGGVLLTRDKKAEIGAVVESGNTVSLQSSYGVVDYKKESLLWYATERDIDSFFKAGQKARAEGNTQAAMILFTLSVDKESSSHFQAQAELDDLRKKLADTVSDTVATTAPVSVGATVGMKPGDKIARARQMIKDGENMLVQKHLDEKLAATSRDTAGKIIADGKKLLAEGEKELAEIRAQQTETVAQQKEWEDTDEALEKEKGRNNLIIGSVFVLIVLVALWQISMKESAV